MSTDWPYRVRKRVDQNGICLCTENELPDWHFQHRQLHSGYRYCASAKSAVISLTYWHNESINIWSHYIVTVYLLCRLTLRLKHFKENFQNEYPSLDVIILFVVCLFGCVLPMLTSAVCHNFYCISRQHHKFCWFFDFFGILSSMGWQSIGFVYFNYYEKPLIQFFLIFYIIICYFLAFIWCYMKYSKRIIRKKLIPKDRFPEFSASLKIFGVICVTIPQILVWITEYARFFDCAAHFQLLTRYSLYPIFSIVGILLFAQGSFPERFHKLIGVDEFFFDMLGHSHQIWHFFSAISITMALDAVLDQFEMTSLLQNICPNI